MSKLGQVVESVEKYNQFVLDQVKRARTDKEFGRDLVGRWNDIKAKIPTTRTPTGIPLPLFVRRRNARRVSVSKRCLSRNVSRAHSRGRKLREERRNEKEQDREENSTNKRTDAVVFSVVSR